MSDRKYAILMETSGEMYESWYYFLRYDGNEDALETIQRQFDDVRWKIFSHYATFDLDLENLVSDKTASEMIRVSLNPTYFHRKFDGILQEIDFGFESGEKNKTRIKKVNRLIGEGKIENFIDEEELVTEDEGSSGSECSDSESCESDSSSDSSEEEGDAECDEGGEKEEKRNRGDSGCRIPSVLG